MSPMYRFTIVFDLIDGNWSFFCIYANTEEEALKEWADKGYPHTFGMFFTIRKIEKTINRF